MHEQIMKVTYVDIVDNDHGGATLEVALESRTSGQSYMLPVDKHTAYELLRLLDVQRFNQARGKYVVVLREDAFGFIKGIKRLPCDPPCELILGDNNE